MRKVKTRVKKLVALLAVMAMVLAMGIPVSAEGEYSITITSMDGKANHVFKAYQIFSGTISTDGKTLSDVQWGSGIDSTKLNDIYDALKLIDIDGEKPFNSLNAETAASVSDVLSTYKDGAALAEQFQETIVDYLSEINTSVEAVPDLAGSYYTDITDAGYYLIKDEVEDGNASDLILQVVGKAEAYAKLDSTPSIDKYAGIEDVSDNASWSVGDKIPYTLVGTLTNYVADGTYTYTFTDTMDAALTLDYTPSTSNASQVDGGVKVFLNPALNPDGTVDEASSTDVTGYFKPITYVENTDGTHTLTISSTTLDSVTGIDKNSKIYVTYYAMINSAVKQATGIDNKVKLTTKVGEADSVDTIEITEEVYPITMKVTKVDGTNEAVTLSEAEFILYREDADGNKAYAVVGTNNKITGWTGDKASATSLKTNEDGTFTVIGLSDGTFKLEETKAPSGYNQLKAPVTVEIDASAQASGAGVSLATLKYSIDGGTAADGNIADGTVSFNVANNKGAELPSTGGIGTTIFYVIGGILVIGAGVLLIVRKRMGSEK